MLSLLCVEAAEDGQTNTNTQIRCQDFCTLQLPEASVQDGVEGDVGGAVAQPARSLHTLGRGGGRGGGEDRGGWGRRVKVRGPLTSGGAGG